MGKAWCLLLVAGLLTLSACTARKTYPDAQFGWHSGDYAVLFGRLQKLPPATTDGPPAWTVKFGDPLDQYAGEVALTPPERLVGFSGGERVEVRGHMLNKATEDAYNGRWYVADSIRIWEGQK